MEIDPYHKISIHLSRKFGFDKISKIPFHSTPLRNICLPFWREFFYQTKIFVEGNVMCFDFTRLNVKHIRRKWRLILVKRAQNMITKLSSSGLPLNLS